MITFVFPGQGSQSKGMGQELFDEFKELTAKADSILGYSIKELCLEDPHDNLNNTQYTQPALYVVNALSYIKKIKDMGRKPDFAAGHSLGEYVALFAAGAFDFETGLKLVKKRGELMAEADGGGMAAIIGLNEEKVLEIITNNNLLNIDIANYNSPRQIVISGPKADIENAKVIFEETQGVQMLAVLKTSGAFHSHCMTAAKKDFELFLKDFEFSELSIPVISNVHARPYKPNSIKENIIEQITHPVKWTESIRYLMGIGDMEFAEVGNGKVLTGLIQRIKREASPLIIEKEELEAISKAAYKNESEEEVCEREADKVEAANAESANAEAVNTEAVSILGSIDFKREYKLRHAYLAGGMHMGISSQDFVIKMGKAGMLGFLGTKGLQTAQIEDAIKTIKKGLSRGQAYGVNVVHSHIEQEKDNKVLELLLKHGVNIVEASGYLYANTALVWYHAKGLKEQSGIIQSKNKLILKAASTQAAQEFLCPAPEWILEKLLSENKITKEEAELSRRVPIADAICVTADAAGYTEGNNLFTLIPAAIKLRDKTASQYKFSSKVYVGAAGGIGTPEAAMTAFMLGADFILTGSINLCTAEAAVDEGVKDMLQQTHMEDTSYTVSMDMLELGAKAQVLKKGLFFPIRANKLYELYCKYDSLNEINEGSKTEIQGKYFKRSFEEVFEDIKKQLSEKERSKAEQNPKYKMALIFRWYFEQGIKSAVNGQSSNKLDYNIPCSSALGAFNQRVKGTHMEAWRNREADKIGEYIMTEADKLIKLCLQKYI